MAIDYAKEVANIKAPILAINGKEDTVVPPETAQEIVDASTNPDSQVLLLGNPERFDIVICDYPNTDDGMYRVKRVIGLPGETIELRGGELYVNGEHIEQNFEMTPNETNFGPFTVPEGHYFVMGDNRNNSKDSRNPMVGALERKMIKGHVRCVVFPLNKARIMEN